jgi:hypothetical protein
MLRSGAVVAVRLPLAVGPRLERLPTLRARTLALVSGLTLVTTLAMMTPLTMTPLTMTPLTMTPLTMTPLTMTPLGRPARRIDPQRTRTMPFGSRPVSPRPIVPALTGRTRALRALR